MSNPYTHADFFSFFLLFFKRLIHLFPGGFASDEVQWALLGSVALSSSLIGTFLVLKRLTMFANALSHTLLFGIAVSYLCALFFFQIGDFMEALSFPLLLISALLSALLTTFLVQFLTKIVSLKEEVSIAFVFITLFAIGIFLVTLFAKNAHIGTELIMGNSDLIQRSDLTLSFLTLVANALFILLFLKELTVISFDPLFARTIGISAPLFHFLLLLFTSLTLTSSFRSVGLLMVLSFLVSPTMIARLFVVKLSHLLLLSGGVALFTVALGVALSRHLYSTFGIGLSTGGLIVILFLMLYLLAFGLRKLHCIAHEKSRALR